VPNVVKRTLTRQRGFLRLAIALTIIGFPVIDSKTYITGWTGNQGNKRKLRKLQAGMQKNMSNLTIAGKNYKGFDLQGKFKLVRQGLKGSNKTYLTLDSAQ